MKQEKKTIAVFDVDETLIQCKSMFSFLEFAFWKKFGKHTGKILYKNALNRIYASSREGCREDSNRLFYKEFSGWHLMEIDLLAKEWFLSKKIIFIY